MERYICPSSSETSTENQIDELPAAAAAWSGTEEIPEMIIYVAGTDDKLIIPCFKSSSTPVKLITDENDHTTLDILISHGDEEDEDEILPCCSDDEMTSLSMEEEVLLEMIDVGLQKVSFAHLQDSAQLSKSWCIYKVEQNLKKVHEEFTFHPKLISIGPFHHKSEHLKLMEQHKWRFFSDFLRSMKPTYIKHQQFLVSSMKKLEARARACYSETFDDLGSNEFVQMMLLDGCFIIQLLLLFQKSGRSCRNADDPMYTWRSTLPHLRHDLLLLENQLPFLVLRELFEMPGINKEQYKLTDLIFDFFNPVLYREDKVLDVCKKQLYFSNEYCCYNHLLELFMSSFPELIPGFPERIPPVSPPIPPPSPERIPSPEPSRRPERPPMQRRSGAYINFPEYFPRPIIPIPEPPAAYFPDDIPRDSIGFLPLKKKKDMSMMGFFQICLIGHDTGHHAQDMSIHCVTELKEAGIEFKKSDDHHDLLDIEFKNGSLHIPTLFMDDNTVPVLLNFIAYEQRHHSIKPYFTSYLMFLDYLVNSSKDVEHLHYKGIINHGLGSDEEVATLFNKLCKEVVQDLGDNNYLSQVFTDVNKYFGKRWNRSRAAWKHEYFRTPWAFSSFLAAIVLLVLTFLQTYFTMHAYFRPPSN